jgi:hypothetical protein
LSDLKEAMWELIFRITVTLCLAIAGMWMGCWVGYIWTDDPATMTFIGRLASTGLPVGVPSLILMIRAGVKTRGW